MQKIKSIPYKLVEDSFEKGLQDTLAYWLMLKSHYEQVPIYYKSSARLIAKILDCSPTTSSKHIKIMIREGWARMHSGNLCMTSTNKLAETYKTFIIKVPVSKIKSHQVYYLRHVLIYRKLDFQKKQIKVKTEIVNRAHSKYGKLTRPQRRLISSFGGVSEFEKFVKNNDRLTVSNKKIGEYLNRSQSSGARYQKIFNQMGLIKSIQYYRKLPMHFVTTDIIDRYKYDQKVRAYKDGFLSYQTSNTIIILPFS